jgi:hypothetical protein
VSADTDGETFDPGRILATLDAHGVEYLMVGGLGARAHGARRPTGDIDFVPKISDANYERLAAALRELGARLRVGRMTDEEARQLPVRVDAVTLRSFGNSTWTTDGGAIDILRELPDRTGRRHTYDELVTRGVAAEIGGFIVHIAALDDIVASKEFAGRDKDNEVLPELRDLQRRARPKGTRSEPTRPPPPSRSRQPT